MTEHEPAAEFETTAGGPSAAGGGRRESEFRLRQLFAQAQEMFAAADFDGARRCLEEVAYSDRTDDVRRLFQLVAERLNEVAELRREIETVRNGQAREDVLLKVRRLLELQPGDERASELLHRLEEGDGLFNDRGTVMSRPQRRSRSDGRRGRKPSDGDSPRGRRRKPSRDEAVPVEFVEDDSDADSDDDVWDFGEQSAAAAPPPLRRSHRERRVDDDFDDPFGGQSSQVAVWIAVAVSGLLIFLAVVVTIIALVVEYL
ncbi:MAG: hypothetical protein ACE5KM_19955 [Planctomycetaceae bacterium]